MRLRRELSRTLHLELKQWILNGNNQGRYSKALHEEVRVLSQSEEEVSRLLAEALAVAETISQKTLKTIGSPSFCIPFDAIEAMARVPNRSIQFFAKMNESALFFEGLVVTHSFWRNKKLEVHPEELAQSIRSTISHLGAYSTLIGLWQPGNADERQLVRNIKILAAHFRSKVGPEKLYKMASR